MGRLWRSPRRKRFGPKLMVLVLKLMLLRLKVFWEPKLIGCHELVIKVVVPETTCLDFECSS